MPASAVKHTGLLVEVQQAIHAGGHDQIAIFEQAAIAVAAAHADGERAVVQAADVGRETPAASAWAPDAPRTSGKRPQLSNASDIAPSGFNLRSSRRPAQVHFLTSAP